MNEFEQFKKNMETKHQEMLADFGVPDKLIVSDDTQLWRFSGRVIGNVGRAERFGWGDVIFVMSQSGKLIGAATIYPKGEHLFASVSVTKDIPERLDYDNGMDFVLSPDLQLVDGVSDEEGSETRETYEISTLRLMPYDADMDEPADIVSDVWEDV